MESAILSKEPENLDALHTLHHVQLEAGELQAAEATCRQMLASSVDKCDRGHALAALANVLLMRDDIEAARDSVLNALEIFHETDCEGGVAAQLSNLAIVTARFGDWDYALELFPRSLELCLKLDDDLIVAQVRMNLAEHHLQRGRNADALNELQQAALIIDKQGNIRFQQFGFFEPAYGEQLIRKLLAETAGSSGS